MISSNKTVDYVHLYYTDNIAICSDSEITCALLWPSFTDAKKTTKTTKTKLIMIMDTVVKSNIINLRNAFKI